RVDDLVFKAAELWPGLVPTRAELRREMERVQADKDGLEIFQGCLISELMTAQKCGLHLMNSMLRPTEEALQRLDEFKRKGTVELECARVEARGETGYLYLKQPKYLNAEDGETVGPQEVAVDLILLHPDLKMGVMRGDFVEHPRYQGRRIFNAGLNLTKVYYGKLPYLFYIVRDMGLVNKLYRGLALEEFDLERPENTLEKPWMAVVEAFAIGGGCQLLLVMDYVIAEAGSYFSLPARKEGIIPGCANMRLPRFIGERQARAAANAVGSGMVSAGANRKALRLQSEPLETFRNYMALYAYEQALCHLSDQLVANLERHWNDKQRRLAGWSRHAALRGSAPIAAAPARSGRTGETGKAPPVRDSPRRAPSRFSPVGALSSWRSRPRSAYACSARFHRTRRAPPDRTSRRAGRSR